MAQSSSSNFYVIGIGTSAGGLEALEKFFTNMPPDEQMAFVVVQHLSPDYESHMVELLSKYTPLKVHEARDGMKIKPENIYLIPRRKNMTVFKGKLYLVEYGRGQGLNLPIDIFFESLAKDQGEKAIGIILSGTGSDGTRGLRAIKEMGGMVMAQDASAKFDGMPRSAVSTQLVDYVISPEEMGSSLLSFIKHPCLNRDLALPPAIVEDQIPLEKLFAILRTRTGIDFSDYKPNTILRRIGRRMSINQINEFTDYVKFLEHSPTESQTLYKEFLISVTRFFRDPEAFDLIKKEVIPELLKGKRAKDQIRVWTPGCATGEEAYSLAILFQEYMQETGQHVDIKIFATDIDQNALNIAGRGIYPESTLADVSHERLRDFFIKRGDSYEVLRHVRATVVFAYQNLIKDPPFSRIDLVSCRNLLIYLQPHLQKNVMGLFQFALRPRGYLLLGSSETVGEYADIFVSHHNRWKLYRNEGDSPPPIREAISTGSDLRPIITRKQSYPKDLATDWHSNDAILRSLVEQMMPPCVVVDDKQNVIHTFGSARQYLEAPTGYQVTLNIMNMIRAELTLPLSTAIHRTLQNQEEVTYNHIRLENGAEEKYINLTTNLFWERNNRQRLILITFEESNYQPIEADRTEKFDINQGAVQRIDDLEHQLQYTKENLQATIEELETSNEELQATNEELLAANEELQSTNEELQSVNEELITVNNEYQLKIRELTRLNNDINNLLSATDIGTVFLDTNMIVRRFTPAVQEAINLIEQDIDRPFRHISHNLVGIDLYSEAQQVLETKIVTERECRSHYNHWYIVKIHPYLTHAQQADGVVVISLIDVTRRRQAEREMNDYSGRLELVMQAGNLAWWEMDVSTGQVTFNQQKTDMLGFDAADFSHYDDFTKLVHPDDYEKTMEAMRSHFRGETPTYQVEYRIRHQNGSYLWYQDVGRVIEYSSSRDPLIITGITINITSLKQAENEIKQHHQTKASLQRNQSMLSQTQRLAKIGSWELNLQTDRLIWSDEVFHIFETSPEEFAATYEAFLELVHPDDRERVAKTYQQSVESKTPYHISHRIQLPNGAIKYVDEWSETFFNNDGQPTHSVGLVQEKPQENTPPLALAQFQHTVSTSADAFIMTDPTQPDNPVIYVNKSFEKQTGYCANEIIGKNPRLMQNSDNDQPELENLRQALKAGISGQATVRNYRKDGSLFTNRVTIYPLKDSNGEIVRWVGIQQCMTEQESDQK